MTVFGEIDDFLPIFHVEVFPANLTSTSLSSQTIHFFKYCPLINPPLRIVTAPNELNSRGPIHKHQICPFRSSMPLGI